MEHAHEFEIRDEATGTDYIDMVAEGTVNGTRYRIDEFGARIDDHGDVFLGYHWSFVKGVAKDLRQELEPLRPELTDDDYRQLAHDIYKAAQEYADDYFRESSRRFTPN